MRTDIRVGTWVRIDDHCPLEFSIDGDAAVELLMGDRHDGHEMIFSPAALERFLALGAEALAKAKQQIAEHEAAELAEAAS